MAYVALSAVTGASVQVLSQGATPNSDCVRLLLYGTYTAADFYLKASDGVIFHPAKVVVYNTTDATGSVWFLDDTTNLVNSGYTQVAAGDKTAVAKASAGVSYDGGKLQFDVTACGPITDNDEVIIELYRG